MVSQVAVSSFAAAHADGALVLDVREPHEYAAGHVPGARLVPLATLNDALRELPTSQPIYVICHSGTRSQMAAQLLGRAGHDARSVIGGTSGWISEGRPVVRGRRANAA